MLFPMPFELAIIIPAYPHEPQCDYAFSAILGAFQSTSLVTSEHWKNFPRAHLGRLPAAHGERFSSEIDMIPPWIESQKTNRDSVLNSAASHSAAPKRLWQMTASFRNRNRRFD